MSIRRIVPNIISDQPAKNKEFYTSFLGLEVAMEREEIIIFASPDDPTTQISLIRPQTDIPHPHVSVEVADVGMFYKQAKEQKLDIVYPLTDEPWGVRRFFIQEPNGAIINILSHLNDNDIEAT